MATHLDTKNRTTQFGHIHHGNTEMGGADPHRAKQVGFFLVDADRSVGEFATPLFLCW